MFTLIDTIEKVDKYVIGEDNIFIISSSDIKYNEFVKLPHNYDRYNPIFLTYKSCVYYSNFEEELFEFNADTRKVSNFENFLGVVGGIHENLFVVDSEDGAKIINLDNKKIIKEFKEITQLSRPLISSSFMISKLGRRSNEIIVYDITKDTSNTISISKKLDQVININDEMYLLLFADKSISCRDIYSQKQLWQISLLNYVSNKKGIKDRFVQLNYYHKGDIAYLLVQEYLFELKMNGKQKPSVTVTDFSDGNKGWYFNQNHVYDEYITFSAGDEAPRFSIFIGVMDRKTKEVLWSMKAQNDFFTEAPQLKDNRLYALDYDKNLLIFEKS